MKTVLLWLKMIEGAMAVAAYAVTVTLLLADVVSREAFSQSIWGAQKIAVFGAIVAGILGLTIAVSDNAHLRPTFADSVVPSRIAVPMGDLLSAALFAGLGYFAVVFVSESISFNDRAEVIGIPLWPIQIFFPYAFFSAALKHLIFAIRPDLKPGNGSEG